MAFRQLFQKLKNVRSGILTHSCLTQNAWAPAAHSGRHSPFPIQQTPRNPAYGSSGALLLTRKIKACCRNTRLSSATHKPLLSLSCYRVTPTSSSGRHSQLYCCCVLCGWDRFSLNCRACLWTRAPDSMWNPPAPQSPHRPLSRFPFLFGLRLFFSSQAGTSVRTPNCCIISWLRSQKYG